MDAQSIDALLSETRHANARRRRTAVRELCPCVVRANHTRIWDRIFELIRDPDLGVRRVAFHALIDGSPKDREAEVLASAEHLLDDPSEKLRRQARKLLAAHRHTGRVNIDGA